MLVTSRSYAEYRAMFDLDDQALAGNVLDCCGGSSSFVAEFVERGGTGVAVDPVYGSSNSELESATADGLGGTTQIVDSHGDRFVWDWYGTAERRDDMRREATARFLVDIDQRPEHYVAGALPDLPFGDRSFDLVLCSHLLFTWSNQLDADWHLAAITEMLRIARQEVRMYPLVVQGTGDQVPFFDDLVARLRGDGHEAEVRRVPYMFQRGADSMLVVRPSAAFAG